jgi:hypothetical protein
MNRRTGLLAAAVLLAAFVPAAAQWLNVPTKGIPRTKDGKPDLTAPAPRKPDGKPDLSGIWKGDAQNAKYLHDVAADFKPGQFPIQPWAGELTNDRATNTHANEFPPARCLPAGIPIEDTQPFVPRKIIQEADLALILNEIGSFRQIFIDGRELPKDPTPTWWGYSVGHWEGDALVVDTTGFNGKTWLDDKVGHPSTDALKITERFRRRDFGHLDLQLAIDDPKAYTKPWTMNLQMQLLADTELLEYVCNENEKDQKHLVGK